MTGAVFVAGVRSLAHILEPRNQKTLRPIRSILRLMMTHQGLRSESNERKRAKPLGSRWSHQALPIAELLDMFCAHAATDRRDKIYALMGLSHDLAHSDIQVDYTKPWPNLFKSVIRHVLGPLPTIHTWENSERAVIMGSGVRLAPSKSTSMGSL